MAQLRFLQSDGTQPELFQPASEWRPYVGPLPRLSQVSVGLDTETRDDGLAKKIGPGWRFGLGHLAGVSVAWGDQAIYVPVRHPDTECRPVGEVLEWVEHIMRNCDVHFFNAGYDLAWLAHEGLSYWPEKFHDAYISSVMLDENQLSYELDACCARAGVACKDERLLREAARSLGLDPKSGIWRMPARYVGPYAEQDAASTLELSRRNLVTIEEERQTGAYQTEIDLVRVIYDMTRRGIRVNEDAAAQAVQRCRGERDGALAEISRMVGWQCGVAEINSPKSLERIFQTQSIDLPRTKKSNQPSVTKEWLARLQHPIGGLLRHAGQFDDLAEKFLSNYVLSSTHLGRIHASIHQLRDSEGGTRSHRLSYSNPPLHQMPTRADPKDLKAVEIVKMIRSIFEPEIGEWWAAPDYAGQEPRILVHLAAECGERGGEEMVQRYLDNPRLDYHGTVAAILGWTRAAAKDTNQGLAYGMGVKKLAATLGCTLEEAEDKLRAYHQGMPYVRDLTEFCSNMAKARGYIRLLDNARCHFDEWLPAGSTRRSLEHEIEGWSATRGREAAVRRWPGRILERAFTHKALNRACQGGAARQMKRAMVACHQAGIRLLVSMHDELDASISTRREAETMQECMVDAVKLRVPMLVDLEVGRNWGDAKHSLEEIGL